MPAAQQIYISTGDLSGEQHAAALLREMLRLSPGLRCTAMGEETLRSAGAEIVCDIRRLRVMGFAEICRHLVAFYRLFRAAVAHVARELPAAAVLVDYPGFHLRLARAIRRVSPRTRIIYYIAPKAWAWRESRVRTLRQYIHRLLCIFPFEESWFRERGLQALYVGNPTWEAMQEMPQREAARAELGINRQDRLIAIFPGSRAQEIRRMLPVLLEAAALLRQRFGIDDSATPSARRLAFALATAPGVGVDDLQRAAPLPRWLQLCGSSLSLLAASDLALTKSGTIALETALALVPAVVIYCAHPLSAWLGRRLVKAPFFSLPNIIAGQPLLTELFQEKATADNIASAAGALLADAAHYEKTRAALRAMRDLLGDRPASKTAARAVLAEIAAAPRNKENSPEWTNGAE